MPPTCTHFAPFAIFIAFRHRVFAIAVAAETFRHRKRRKNERMGCFACFESRRCEKKLGGNLLIKHDDCSEYTPSQPVSLASPTRFSSDKAKPEDHVEDKDQIKDGNPHIPTQTFTFRELAAATKGFRPECLIGEGGFGHVYKGRLESTGQIVAIKQLDRSGLQGNREFLVEVLMLSLLHHPNLVNLIGYCADGDQRLLVYEYMPLGCLEDHLHDLPSDKEPLDWNMRMKIAAGAARGLEYLHDKANPPVIYRDFKSSNILLDKDFHPKLSDFGLAKLGPVGDKTHVSTRVMGTYGYCAPEYAMTGQLTVKSDVYSFGVVLLELITGRKAIDNSRPLAEHNLVAWARPHFKDRRKFYYMADPLFQGHYPVRGLCQAIAIAAMCLQEDAAIRPVIGDVVTALSYLADQKYDPTIHPVNRPLTPGREKERERKLPIMEGQKVNNTPSKSSPDHQYKTTASTQANGSCTSDFGNEGICSRKRDSGEWNIHNGQIEVPEEDAQNGKVMSDRERAVAEARIWGENWRERKRGSGVDGFDGGLI